MSKLTLSVDKSIALRAKRYSKQRHVSVSKLVEEYLDVISMPPQATDLPPILRSLRGTLKSADPAEYRKYLVKKYR
jgi:hypothetical protein